jgi:hypothetical protein
VDTLWYRVDAPTDGKVSMSGFYSDFTLRVGIEVFSGSPGSLQSIGCDFVADDTDGNASFVDTDVTAGQSYYVMMAIPQSYHAGTNDSEWVRFSANYVPPPRPDPHVTAFTVNLKGPVTKAGTATIGGTIRCEVSGFASVHAVLTQVFARSTAQADATFGVPCTTSLTPWSMSLTSSTSVRFGSGTATASGSASTSGDLGGTTLTATRKVGLHTIK